MKYDFLPVNKPQLIISWRVYLSLAILQSVLAIILMLLSPPSSDTALLLGLSRERLILALSIFSTACLFLWLFIKTWITPNKTIDRLRQIISLLENQPAWGVVLLALGLFSLTGSYLITLTPEITEPYTKAYFDRLLPIIIWATGLSILTLISLLWTKYGSDIVNMRPKGKAFYIIMVLIGAVFLTWSWLAKTIIPGERLYSGLNTIGAPIIGTQLLLAWGAGMIMLLFGIVYPKSSGKRIQLYQLKPSRIDFIICLTLWVITVFLWQSMPIASNWFISEPISPNYEYYPTSDARNYDLTTQLALVGEGFQFFYTPYVRRPLHAIFLTTFHLLGGQDYEAIAFLQVLLLALLPPFIYLLTKSIHNRISGVMAAVLILLRETNSISIGGNITVSHAKQFMVDLPMALGVVIFMYLVVLWMKQLEKGTLLALITGGFLGLIMLIRPETLVFIFPLFLILAIILFPKKHYGLWVKHIILFILGITLVISPWVWRNWKKTGLLFLDSPVFYNSLIALRYKPIPTEAPPLPTEEIPNESSAIDSTPLPTLESTTSPAAISIPLDKEIPSGTGDPIKDAVNKAIVYIKTNTRQITGFIITHYLNSQIQTFLILPTSFRGIDSITAYIGHHSPEKLWEECCSVRNYVRRMPYWHDWDGTFPSQAFVPLTGIILFFAFGVNESWKKQKIVGITPILLCTTYLLLNALFRNSGGRYILPVDWSGVIYFSIGLAYISTTVLFKINPRKLAKDPLFPQSIPLNLDQKNFSRSKTLLAALCLFLVGCSIPLFEASFPQRYTPTRQDAMTADLFHSDLLSKTEQQDLQTFLSQSGIIITGRGLYPRYFPSNVGEAGKKTGPLAPKPYPRLVFLVVGPNSPRFALPLTEEPSYFPNASDVLVFGCPDQEALAVAVYNSTGSPAAFYWRSPLPAVMSCPLQIDPPVTD